MMAVFWGLFGKLRPHLLALVGVIAVAGVGTAVLAGFYVRQQRQTIEQQEARLKDKMAQINGLIAANDHMVELRTLEQQNTLELETKLDLIETHHASLVAEVRKLEASNADVKAFMDRRIPPDLRRLLQQK